MKPFAIQGEFADRIVFQESPHATLFDGKPVAGVSHILNTCGVVETFSGEPGYAALRGSYIHEAIAFKLRDELDEDSLTDSIRGYYEAAMQFLSDSGGLEPLYVEQPVIGSRDLIFDGGDVLIYGGNLDFFGERRSPDGRSVTTELVDWKAGQVGGDRYAAQLGGYWKALANTVLMCGKPIATPDCLTNVQLKPNGTYKLVSHDVKKCVALWDRCMDGFINGGGK